MAEGSPIRQHRRRSASTSPEVSVTAALHHRGEPDPVEAIKCIERVDVCATEVTAGAASDGRARFFCMNDGVLAELSECTPAGPGS